MNTMSAEEAHQLADRIHARGWGWRNAFEAWYRVFGGCPNFDIADDGTRIVLRDATEFIKTNLANLPRLGLGEIVQADGTLRLDTAGEYRYRPLGIVGEWGFTAYERIHE